MCSHMCIVFQVGAPRSRNDNRKTKSLHSNGAHSIPMQPHSQTHTHLNGESERIVRVGFSFAQLVFPDEIVLDGINFKEPASRRRWRGTLTRAERPTRRRAAHSGKPFQLRVQLQVIVYARFVFPNNARQCNICATTRA